MRRYLLYISSIVISFSFFLFAFWNIGYRYNKYNTQINSFAFSLSKNAPKNINSFFSSLIEESVIIIKDSSLLANINSEELQKKTQNSLQEVFKKYPFVLGINIIMEGGKTSFIQNSQQNPAAFNADFKTSYSYLYDENNTHLEFQVNTLLLAQYLNHIYSTKITHRPLKLVTVYYFNGKLIPIKPPKIKDIFYQDSSLSFPSKLDLKNISSMYLKKYNLSLYKISFPASYINNFSFFLGFKTSLIQLSYLEIYLLILTFFLSGVILIFGFIYAKKLFKKKKTKKVYIPDYPSLRELVGDVNNQSSLNTRKKEKWEEVIQSTSSIDITLFCTLEKDKINVKAINKNTAFFEFLIPSDDFILNKITSTNNPFFISQDASYTTPVRKILKYFPDSDIIHFQSLLFIPLDKTSIIIHLFQDKTSKESLSTIYNSTLQTIR